MKKNLMRTALAVAAAGALAVTAAGCSSSDAGSSDGKVTIELFQYKTEAKGTIDKLIAEFNKENPDITVKQTAVADAVTVLKSRLAKNQVPDLISLNVSAYYDMAQSGLLADLTDTEAYSSVTDTTALDYMNVAGQTDDNLALPWATNAQIVLYDVDAYNELGLTVPTTWDEFIGNAEVIKESGATPFSFGWKDTWAAMMLTNSLVASSKPTDLLAQLQSGETTFETQPDWGPAVSAGQDLKPFAQADAFGTNYDDSIAAFANKDAVMLVNGTWTIPTIRQANPDLNVGAFVMPSPIADASTKMPSGPDAFIARSAESKNGEAAQKFMDFLFTADAQKVYADEQMLFSVRNDVVSEDPLMAEIKTDWIDAGNTASYSDGMFSGGTNYWAINWDFLNTGDEDTYLAALDADFAKNGVQPSK